MINKNFIAIEDIKGTKGQKMVVYGGIHVGSIKFVDEKWHCICQRDMTDEVKPNKDQMQVAEQMINLRKPRNKRLVKTK